jgi:phosphopantothenoylcysteine decarboxylase / phosphopantothenate---cysteine ligase
MTDWDFNPPPESQLSDRAVPLEGEHLLNKRIALLVSGGIAAMKAPLIARALRKEGANVVAFTSKEALRYTTIDALEWSTTNRVITKLTAAAEHLSDSDPFAAYLLAPATYNTINKMRYGIADGVVTSTLASAIGRMEGGKTKIAIAPTMHGSLHNSILTESLKTLHGMGVYIISPREAYGKHNIPDEREITVNVCRLVSHSPLKDVPILVTGGPTPVPIDNVRRLTNRFSGKLGSQIAEELYLRGADVRLIHGEGTYQPPAYLPYQVAKTYDEYQALVIETLKQKKHAFGIFSAAVADYQPQTVLPGKTPSGGVLKAIDLVPTRKVIEEVKAKFPGLNMITFKYQEGISHEALIEIARQRLERGYSAVVANRGEEMGSDGEQVAYLVTAEASPQRIMGKKEIAKAIADRLEREVWHNNP